MELDDLGTREQPSCLLGEAHHEDSALRKVRRMEARNPGLACAGVDCSDVEPGRADDYRNARAQAAIDVLHDGVRGREVDRDIALVRPRDPSIDDLVAGVLESGNEDGSDLPPTP